MHAESHPTLDETSKRGTVIGDNVVTTRTCTSDDLGLSYMPTNMDLLFKTQNDNRIHGHLNICWQTTYRVAHNISRTICACLIWGKSQCTK